jgi:peptidoglycan hydrolase-like protein with peptidoglycan-binding domain
MEAPMSTAAASPSRVVSRILAALTVLGCASAALAMHAALAAPDSKSAERAVVDQGDGPEVDEEQIEDLVADAQRLLNLSGYAPGPIDGQFGPRTQRAIRAYQAAARRHGTLEAIKGPPPDDLAPRPELAGAAPSMPSLTQ